jgi:hypothetical protein
MTDNELTRELSAYFDSVALQRPAEGELSRALDTTARIRPRPAWQAQLTGAVETLGGPASLGLRYALLLVLLLLALALLSLGLAGLGKPPSIPGPGPFEGRWRALDPDGSDLSLVVGAGAAPDVRFEDNYASACANRGDSSTRWISFGTGLVDNGQMSVHYPDGGGCSTWRIEAYFDLFTYDADANTLTDSLGNLWRRPAPN